MVKSIYGDKILINIIPSEEGEYILPQGHQGEEQLSGRVAFIGEEVKKTAVGDIVVFGQYDYNKVMIEGIGYIQTNEDNLICKLKENE